MKLWHRFFWCFLFGIHDTPTLNEVMHSRRIDGRKLHCRACQVEAWHWKDDHIVPVEAHWSRLARSPRP